MVAACCTLEQVVHSGVMMAASAAHQVDYKAGIFIVCRLQASVSVHQCSSHPGD